LHATVITVTTFPDPNPNPIVKPNIIWDTKLAKAFMQHGVKT